EADVAQRELVALMVLAETAGTAGARRHVDVARRDFCGADLGRLAAQVIGQVAGREAGWTALADVRNFAPGEQILAGRRWQRLRPVPEVLQRRLDEALGAPVQAAEEDGGRLAFRSRKRPRLVGAIRLDGGARRRRDRARFRRVGGGCAEAVR